MALNVNSNLGAKTIAELAAIRLYDSFPLNLVSHAQGTRAFKMPFIAAETTGTVAVVAENAAQGSIDTFRPVIGLVEKTLETYRANVTISNELVYDSSVLKLIADRLSGQILEVVGKKIITDIRTKLVAGSRYTLQDNFSNPANMDADTPIHSGFTCMANLQNMVRDRAVWVFGKLGYQSFGDMEGRASLVTLPIQRRTTGQSMFSQSGGAHGGGYGAGKSMGGIYVDASGAVSTIGSGSTSNTSTQQLLSGAGAGAGEGGGGGGGGGGGNVGNPSGIVQEESKNLNLEKRGSNPLEIVSHDPFELTTAWLGKPVYTSDGMGTMSTTNAMWMMLVDLSCYLHFSQPLQITLDTESLAENNRTVIQCSYRCAGDLMDAHSGYGLRHGTT